MVAGGGIDGGAEGVRGAAVRRQNSGMAWQKRRCSSKPSLPQGNHAGTHIEPLRSPADAGNAAIASIALRRYNGV